MSNEALHQAFTTDVKRVIRSDKPQVSIFELVDGKRIEFDFGNKRITFLSGESNADR